MFTIDKLGTTVDTNLKARGVAFDDLVIRASWNPTASPWPPPQTIDQLSLGGRWSVNLLPWQNAGSQSAQTAFPRNRTFLQLGTARAKLILGTEGANETYEVDYPAAGTSIAVAARTLEVHLLGATAGGVDPTIFGPVIGAYLSQPCGAPGPMTATLTTAPNVVAPESSFAEAVPPRARRFRLLLVFAAPNAPAINLSQVDGNGNPLAIIDFAGSSDSFKTPAARSQWYPLLPDCQVVNLSNTDAVNSQSVAVQWELVTCS